MRVQTGTFVAVLSAILGFSMLLSASAEEKTYRGMFGDRTLGGPLKPRESRFRSGLARGPSGSFKGLSTENRGTTFRNRARPEPASPSLVPPEAYDLEPDMVPGYLEEQARRMAALRQQILEQQKRLQQRQQQPPAQQQPLVPPPVQRAQPAQPSFPPLVMPARPDRYLPPAWSIQPGFPQPQPGVPGAPAEELPGAPDRWFRGAPSATPQGQQVPAMPPTTGTQPYAPSSSFGPAGTLGPSGVRGQAGLNRATVSTLGARISQTLGARARSPIAATVLGDMVTLQGTVSSATDRQLAQRIAAMEPGVRRIDNRIQVVPTPATP